MFSLPARAVGYGRRIEPCSWVQFWRSNSSSSCSSITADDYQERRCRLSDLCHEFTLDNHPKAQLVLIPATTQLYSTIDVPYRFRQNTDFRYFAGLEEPDCVLALVSVPSNSKADSNQLRSTLFLPRRTAHQELWEGPGPSDQAITQRYGFDNIEDLIKLEPFLAGFFRDNGNKFDLFLDSSSRAPKTAPKIANILQRLVQESRSRARIHSPLPFSHQARWLKSKAEIGLMRRSCEIIASSVRKTMKFAAGKPSENWIAANIEYEAVLGGADRLAFPPVVAGGPRALTIHYLYGTQPISDGDMILVDSGCEYEGYVSDLSRSWPINGSPKPAQRSLYEALREVQETLLDICQTQRPITIQDLHVCMYLLLGESLQRLGILDASLAKEDAATAAEKFCPHSVGHYLGMDCHDTDTIPRNRELQPGVIITVEPGIYIGVNEKSVPTEFRGIGLRIEDDVLFTETGCEVLTKSCPKDLDSIRQIISQ